MKVKFLVVVLIFSMICPPVSHGFGLLRWTFDAIRNQFGFDRGPIPKTMQCLGQPCLDPQCPSCNGHPDAHRIHIQAEGF